MAMVCWRDMNVTVTHMNNFIYPYLDELGVTDEAKQEFVSKAKAPSLGLEAFESFKVWKRITEPYQILQKMEAMGPFEVVRSTSSVNNNRLATDVSTFSPPHIDLNLPPHGQVASNEEEDSSTSGKPEAEMIDCTLRL